MLSITLTSDFGSQNYALASVKGKILSAFPESTITDISNTITPFNLQQAVYIFKQAYRYFPSGSFHFIFNDLYADSKRQLLYAFENQQHIFCADNGFLTLLFDDKPIKLYRLTERILDYNYLSVADAFIGHVASILHHNPIGIDLIDVNSVVIKHPAYASQKEHTLEAQVLHIDTFGNVVLNVTKSQFEEARAGRKFKILFMRDEEINQLSEHYNDVPEGNKLCLFNTAGYLEIAIHKGNAASLFGFQIKNERNLFYNNIKLFFE
jgi:S-adenosylmethionine hydrolase